MRQVPAPARTQPVKSPKRRSHPQDDKTPKRSNVKGRRQRYVPAQTLEEATNEWDAQHEPDNASIQAPPDIRIEPPEVSGILDKAPADDVSLSSLGGIAPSIIQQEKDIEASMANELLEFREKAKEISDHHSQNASTEESVLAETQQDKGGNVEEPLRHDSDIQLPPDDATARQAHADSLEDEIAALGQRLSELRIK